MSLTDGTRANATNFNAAFVSRSSAQTVSGGKQFQDYISTASADVATTATIAALSSAKSIIRLTGSTVTSIQGISAGVTGQRIAIYNASSAVVTLEHQNGTATAANRIKAYSGASLALPAGDAVELVYDATQSRWVQVSAPVSGVGLLLGIAQGGTGATTKAGAFDALSPMTTSGDIIYGGASGTGTRLAKGSNGDVLTLAAGVPSWAPASAVSFTAPTIQKFTSGSGTYTKPASVLYLRVRMVGGGGGGAQGAGVSTTGGTGGNTTFGTTLLVANGGSGGANEVGGTGGTASLGAAIGTALQGGTGHGAGVAGSSGSSNTRPSGGAGASSPFGGAGGGAAHSGAGVAAIANTGSGGGGGGGDNVANHYGGGGGGAGGYVDAIITSPSATYSYAVGSAGTAGGSGGQAGADGGSGYIEVTEFYQ